MSVKHDTATVNNPEDGVSSSSSRVKAEGLRQPSRSEWLGVTAFSKIGIALQLACLLTVLVAPEAMAKANDHQFQKRHRPVSLTVMVRGGGTVTSSPEGLLCSGGRCSAEFPRGTVVRLRATPEDGVVLSKWRGACRGSRGCKVRLKRPKIVLASFKTPRPIPLTVFVRGEGTVTSTPEGISCSEGKCRGEFSRGTVVRLHAEPGEGQILKRWRGACWGSKGCKVKLKRPRKVLAVFRTPRLLPLRVLVKGEGTVISSPEGLECSHGVCFGKFPEKTVVRLTAIPDEGQTFKRWRGGCRGSETCTVKLRRSRTVLARFSSSPPSLCCSLLP